MEIKIKIFVIATVSLCSLFAGNFFFVAMADGGSSSALHSIIIAVTANPVIMNLGGHTILTVIIADNSSSPSSPTGTILWSSGSAGGTFNPSSCTLASGSCTTTYTPSPSSPSTVTITASYTGDVAHHGGSNSSQITANVIRPTTTTVTPNSATVSTGSSISFVVQVTDTTSLPITPNGTISWTSGSAGGTFNPSSCTLASGTCTTSYTPALNSPTAATITATYIGDSTHSGSAGISALTVNVLHGTTITLIQNPLTVSSGGSVSFVVKVNDTSSSKTTPTGTVSWTDGNAAGTFNATSCTLSSKVCVFSYNPNANAPNVVTINATYTGDGTHMQSSSLFKLSTNALYSTTITVTPNPATYASGNAVTFTATVADTSHPSAALIGIVSWNDNGAGGAFSPNDCILSGNHCSLSYTPHSNPSTMITITATYVGDSTHSGSSGTSSLSSSPNASQPTNNTSIPQWVRNNAKWWHENSIGDSDFEKGIQYLIQQGIMKIPSTQSGTGTSQQIPSWVKNNAGWWANGQISDDEFVKGIQYLIQQGIIKV